MVLLDLPLLLSTLQLLRDRKYLSPGPPGQILTLYVAQAVSFVQSLTFVLEGPIITYLAKAPSDITKWNPGTAYVNISFPSCPHLHHHFSAVWFKIAQAGKDSSGKWAAPDGLKATNSVYTFTIPPKLQAGQYIVRHEM